MTAYLGSYTERHQSDCYRLIAAQLPVHLGRPTQRRQSDRYKLIAAQLPVHLLLDATSPTATENPRGCGSWSSHETPSMSALMWERK